MNFSFGEPNSTGSNFKHQILVINLASVMSVLLGNSQLYKASTAGFKMTDNMFPKRNTPKTKEQLQKENPFATHESFITKEQVDEFQRLIDIPAGETSLDQFLTKNPEVFTGGLHNFRTGHHGAIIIPKQMIMPNVKMNDKNGLIPDFIIGGKSSDGWDWWVVELKGADQTIFSQTNTETYFNSEINKGLCQLLGYIDYCSEHQNMLRDIFKLEGFREPNGLLIAGRETEILSNSKKQKLKAAWNKVSRSRLEIRTYDSINRNLSTLFDIYNRQK